MIKVKVSQGKLYSKWQWILSLSLSVSFDWFCSCGEKDFGSDLKENVVEMESDLSVFLSHTQWEREKIVWHIQRELIHVLLLCVIQSLFVNLPLTSFLSVKREKTSFTDECLERGSNFVYSRFPSFSIPLLLLYTIDIDWIRRLHILWFQDGFTDRRWYFLLWVWLESKSPFVLCNVLSSVSLYLVRSKKEASNFSVKFFVQYIC